MTLTVTPSAGGPGDDELTGLLRAWLPARRWYPAKGPGGQVDLVGTMTFPGDPDGGRLRVAFARVRATGVDAVLQVPLVLGAGDGDVIGTLGDVPVRDGAGSPEFVAAWLAAASGPGAPVDPATAHVLTGEQSNTSVILSAPGGGTPVAILKVLRTVADGPNPDIEVPRRLVQVGWDGVPAPLGWLAGRWPAPGGDAHGYLGVMSAFVPDAEDGFELACAHARSGSAFDEDAAALGALVADMHAALVRGFGTKPPGPDAAREARAVAGLVAARFAWAAAQVPALDAYHDGVTRVVDDLAALRDAPARQRVHGDLHLGQLLRSSGRWYVTDFEGEPLAPLAERTRPDFAVRDVAGLVRSFDYAAAVGGLHGEAATAWSGSARQAALLAYDEAAGTTLVDPTGAAGCLLRALEVDKAVYEAVYEHRNRPDWLPIPLAGLTRLLR